jgi:hypothetical protein
MPQIYRSEPALEREAGRIAGMVAVVAVAGLNARRTIIFTKPGGCNPGV